MFILAIVGLVMMGAILGFVSRNPEKNCVQHWDYDIKSGKLSSLEMRVFTLEQENNRLNHIYNIYRNFYEDKRCFEEMYYAHCRGCDRTFRSRDMKNKELAGLLNNITLTTEEVAKKLGFDIK